MRSTVGGEVGTGWLALVAAWQVVVGEVSSGGRLMMLN